MRRDLSIIAFDADDTLWQNEQFFRLTEERFASLLADYADTSDLTERLHRAEMRNLGQYGFGIKGFTLSMIETAIEVTAGRVPASVIKELIDAGQSMLCHPVHLLPHAEEVVRNVATDHRVLLITKGDLLDQERKLAQSGLGDLFDGVEIVSDKTPAVYQDIFARHGVASDAVLMAGNSMRSDVMPVLETGGWAVHVPHDLTWTYERTDTPADATRLRVIDHLGRLPGMLRR
ncbi:HAD family hydrolase [Roseovarius pelagicus]|uniref:HAD family hydrolase n=1 Tax=Roseovarius pelagicus TaxID=2980108 RepID=A0ABY6DAB8_9RHOB|nr:HAD family hydrolase [Roseovarius pelagicus]UXX82128.1 HAD family hydrolase [Roseovarius pelagicus]